MYTMFAFAESNADYGTRRNGNRSRDGKGNDLVSRAGIFHRSQREIQTYVWQQ